MSPKYFTELLSILIASKNNEAWQRAGVAGSPSAGSEAVPSNVDEDAVSLLTGKPRFIIVFHAS